MKNIKKSLNKNLIPLIYWLEWSRLEMQMEANFIIKIQDILILEHDKVLKINNFEIMRLKNELFDINLFNHYFERKK